MLGIVVWDWMIRSRTAALGFAGVEVVDHGIEIVIVIAIAMLPILLMLLFVLATVALRFKDLMFNSESVNKLPVGLEPSVPVSTQTCR